MSGTQTVLFICGSPGAGKTTIAETLKKEFPEKWLHFDVDIWQFNLDPIKRCATTPSPEELKACPPELNELRDRFCHQHYLKLKQAAPREEVSVEAACHYYRAVLKDVLKIAKAHPEKNIAVPHAIFLKEVRDFVRSCVVAEGLAVKLVNLEVPPEVLQGRKQKRLEAQAADHGKSLEEFLMSYPLQGDFAERLKNAISTGAAHPEPLGEDEVAEKDKILGVHVAEGDDFPEVFSKVSPFIFKE